MKHLTALILSLAPMAAAAHAGILQVDLVNTALYGNPGDTLAYFATITNTSDTDTIYINGFGTTSVSPFLTIDAIPLFLNGPVFLNPGDITPTFEIFDAILDPAIPAGAYVGNAVSIVGGADGGTFSAFDDLADPSFDVVTPIVTPSVPEPGTTLLMAAGTAVLAILARRRSGLARRLPV